MSTKAKPFVTLTLIAVVVFFASVSVPQGQKAEQKMRYLVTGEYIDPGPMLSPQQGIQIFEQTILPSLEALVKLEAEGKILAGGILVGDRAGVMIVEVDSNAALDQLLQSLPFWGLLKWEITPLTTVADRLASDRQALEHMKKAMQ